MTYIASFCNIFTLFATLNKRNTFLQSPFLFYAFDGFLTRLCSSSIIGEIFILLSF